MTAAPAGRSATAPEPPAKTPAEAPQADRRGQRALQPQRVRRRRWGTAWPNGAAAAPRRPSLLVRIDDYAGIAVRHGPPAAAEAVQATARFLSLHGPRDGHGGAVR